MSYELNRLMQQYGVATPSNSYGGAAMPSKPTAPPPGASAADIAAYNALVQKYNVEMPKYLADKQMFDQYAPAYQDKIAAGSIYNQPQFGFSAALPQKLAAPAYGSGTYSGTFNPLSEMAGPATQPIVINNSGGGGGYGGGGGGSVDGGGGGYAGPFGQTLAEGLASAGINYGNLLGGMLPGGTLAAFAGRGYIDSRLSDAAKKGGYTGTYSGDSAFGDRPNNTTTEAQTQAAIAGTGGSPLSGAAWGGGEYGGGADAPGANADGFGGGDAGFGGGSQPFARGGRVKRKFGGGGLNDLAESYGLSGPPDVYQSAEMNRRLQEPPQAMAQMPTVASAQPPEMDMQALLQRYLPNPVDYSSDIAESRKALSGYNANFNKLLEQAMTQKAAGPSKAELYFNLAAAFGTPGKTGNFFEQLGGAGKVLGEHNKAQRENEREQQKTALMLGMKQQEMGAEGERSNLTTLRQLAAEGAKDQRAVVSKLLENYIQSGKPQSAAGKQALDEGFQPGTPAFNKRVTEVGNMLVDKQMAQINAIVAGMGTQQGQLAVAEGNLGVAQSNLALRARTVAKAEEAGAKLTPGEMKIKLETEDAINSSDQALADLVKAYALNPNTFDTSMVDMAQRKMLEAVGSKDPKLVATREQENLLASQALAKLKTAFGGNPTEGERKIMLDLQGIGSKSKEERAIIIRNTAKALQTARAKAQDRLKKVAAGEYRTATTTPEPVVGE